MSLPVPALRGTERGICFMDNGLVEKMLNKSGKEKILIVLLIGVLLLVIAIPVKSDKTGGYVSGSDTYLDVQKINIAIDKKDKKIFYGENNKEIVISEKVINLRSSIAQYYELNSGLVNIYIL